MSTASVIFSLLVTAVLTHSGLLHQHAELLHNPVPLEREILYRIPLTPGLSLLLAPGDDPCIALASYCVALNTTTSTKKCVRTHQHKVLREILRFSSNMPQLRITEGLFMSCEQSLPRYYTSHEFSTFHGEMTAMLHSAPSGDIQALKLFDLRRTEKRLEILEDIDIYGKALPVHPNSSFIISQLGLTLMKYGRHDLAQSLFKNAVQRGIWLHVLNRPEWYQISAAVSKPWHDPKDYPFITKIEANYAHIRSEVLTNFEHRKIHFSEDISNKPAVNDNLWKVLYLKHPNANNYSYYSKHFPMTTKVLQNCNEDIIEVKFSRIVPGTHIHPHTGPSNDRLRAHLTIVHTGGAWIRVGNEWRTWEEGKVLIFDSSWEHEVYHNGPDPRIVMIFDFWNK